MSSPLRPRDFSIALSFSLKAYPVIDVPAGWCAGALLLLLSWHSLVLFECSDVPGAMPKTAHKVMLCALYSPNVLIVVFSILHPCGALARQSHVACPTATTSWRYLVNTRGAQPLRVGFKAQAGKSFDREARGSRSPGVYII